MINVNGEKVILKLCSVHSSSEVVVFLTLFSEYVYSINRLDCLLFGKLQFTLETIIQPLLHVDELKGKIKIKVEKNIFFNNHSVISIRYLSEKSRLIS